jgi:glycosyltransferase involved in cell wall biosynthesis
MRGRQCEKRLNEYQSSCGEHRPSGLQRRGISEQAIGSVLRQSFSDLELIISDNGSTDRTEEICRRYAARDPRISYHRQPKNRGVSFNYRRAFELARGEYFQWLAHDDVLAPDFLQKCVAALDQDPGAVLCQSLIDLIDEKPG